MALGWQKDYYRYKELFLKFLIIYKKRNDVKMFIEIILSLITIILFSLLAVKPTLITVSQLIKDNREKQETINKMEQKIKNIQIAQQRYDQLIDKVSLIELAVPNTPTPENLLKQIHGIALANSVSIINSSVNEITLIGIEKINKDNLESLPNNVKTLTFTVNATGDYLSLYSFLLDLENSRRPLLITSLNLNLSNKENQPMLLMIISGQTPYIKK